MVNTPDGLDSVPIDLNKFRLDPFFCYPIGFIANAGRGVLRAYLKGELDAEITELFDAAGVTYPLTKQSRRAFIAARVLIISYRKAWPGDVFSQERFTWALRRRWRTAFTDKPLQAW